MSRRLTKTQVRDLLDRHNLGPSRALGQNFLCDGQMVDKIVRLAQLGPGDHVVEIGPGLGSLTLGLADSGAHVEAIEIDTYMIPALEEVLAEADDTSRVSLRNSDVRLIDWPPILGSHSWSVVANLPYNIATPLLLDLMAERPEFASYLVMVQREAGERLVAKPGSKIYGIPSVLTAYWANGQIVGSVPAELFYPKPKVESVLVRLTRVAGGPRPCAYRSLQRVVKAGFGQRRKMIRRSLSSVIGVASIEAAGIDATQRAEQLGLAEWMTLAELTEREQDS